MFYDVPQRSIVGPLLNIYSWELFYFLGDLHIASYTIKKKSVISALQTFSSLLFGWFSNNFMKANSDKSDFWWLTEMIDDLPIDSSKTEEINNKSKQGYSNRTNICANQWTGVHVDYLLTELSLQKKNSLKSFWKTLLKLINFKHHKPYISKENSKTYFGKHIYI